MLASNSLHEQLFYRYFANYLEIHQPLPENPLASMVNLLIVGNLPITAEGFPYVAKRFPGRG
jgi:hypothetical protein